MPVDVITTANSRTFQYSNGAAYLTFLLTEGAYIISTQEGYPAFYVDGGHLNGTFQGTVISGGDIAAIYLGLPGADPSIGYNHVTVGATGLVQGYDGIAAFCGNDDIVNAGTIRSVAQGEFSELSRRGAGVYAFGNTNSVTNTGLITGHYGLYLDGYGNVLTNTGTIATTDTSATAQAIYASGSLSIGNQGTITGNLEVERAVVSIVNHGTIDGSAFTGQGSSVANYGTLGGFSCLAGSAVVDNYGQLGTVQVLGAGNFIRNYAGGTITFVLSSASVADTGVETITNAGAIGSISLNAGADQLTNSGTLGNVTMGDGANVVTNTGTIQFLGGGADADTLDNAGNIATVSLAGGADLVTNRAGGTIGQLLATDLTETTANTVLNDGVIGATQAAGAPFPALFLGDGADTLVNTGTITGLVGLAGGADVVDTSAGAIVGRVDLGDGPDSYTGGAGVDRVTGGAGNDTVDLGAGDDVFRAAAKDGNDAVDGGDGIDTYNASDVAQAVTIDLGNLFTARASGSDTILNFEIAVGGRGDDTLLGSDGANRLEGGGGADVLSGLDGNDRLIGGGGTDTITGGAGRDVMTGDTLGGTTAEADLFLFRAVTDSGTTAGNRDVITDFTDHASAAAPYAKGADTIDLSAIDADTTKAGNQAFTFNATGGAAFSGTAGSLVWQQFAGYALVSGDVNGDKVADFAIQLTGTHTLFASDFAL